MVRALRLAAPLALLAALGLAGAASAHVCVAFLVSVSGPHLHILC